MERTEALLGVRADTVKVGSLGAHIGNGQRQEQEAGAANEPSEQSRTGRGDIGELAGQGKNARTDAGRDDEADQAKVTDTVRVVDMRVMRHKYPNYQTQRERSRNL